MIDSKPPKLPSKDIASMTRILLVSPMPPPFTGISTWTQIIKQRRLPEPFEFELIDTKVLRSHPSIMSAWLIWPEIKRNLKILWKLHRALCSKHFSVVHFSYSIINNISIPRNLCSTLLVRWHRTPYIAHLHGTFTIPYGNSPLALLYRCAYRTIFNASEAIVLISAPSHSAVLKLGDYGHKIRSVPNFFNCQNIREIIPGQEKQGNIKIIYTGALIKAKGVFSIIDIAKQLPDVQFQLVGDAGAEVKAELSRHIQESNITNRVQIIGPISEQEIPGLLEEKNIFLFPSKNEGFPNSVLEAMAVGLPVVASPVGAIPEMIDVPNGGYLIDPDDITGYVEALTRLCKDPLLRSQMGQYNQRKALREYEYGVVIPQLCDIYSGIAKIA